MLSRQQSQNQLDPRYWSIYGSLLGNPISSVLNNPTVVAAGFKLPYPSYPTNLQLQQALRPYSQFSGVDSNAEGQNDGHSTFHALESILCTATCCSTTMSSRCRAASAIQIARGR